MAALCLVGYTYRGYGMSYAMERARAYGYHGIELRDFKDIDLSHPAGVAEALERAHRLAEQMGLTIYSLFFAPLVISRDGKTTSNHELEQVLQLLADYHVPILHTRLCLTGADDATKIVSAEAGDADYQTAVHALHCILPCAERCNVRIALETHMGTIHDTVASQQRIVSACGSPYLVASLDFANILIANREASLIQAIKAFGPSIGYVHLKNVKLLSTEFDWNIPLRFGDINYRFVLQALKKVGYTGPLAVEYCGTGDPDVFAADDARYLAQLLTELEY